MGQSLNATELAGGTGEASQAAMPLPPLPGVECAMGRGEVLDRLSAASKRGRLPGYQNHNTNGSLFTVSAFGHPFDGVLVARPDGSEGPGTRLRFESRLARRMPVFFAIGLAATVWPGLYFMDQLMIQFAPQWSQAVRTWWWYLPLTILSIPWVWTSMMRRTRRSVAESSRTAIERIAREVDGRVVG